MLTRDGVSIFLDIALNYRYSIAKAVRQNPPTKPTSSCRLRLRPKYSRTDAKRPATSSV